MQSLRSEAHESVNRAEDALSVPHHSLFIFSDDDVALVESAGNTTDFSDAKDIPYFTYMSWSRGVTFIGTRFLSPKLVTACPS